MKDQVYNEILEHVVKLLSEHKSVEMIAGCLMVIAQRLYKTQLNEEEYREMMNVIRDAPVKPYDIKKERLH